MNTYTLTEIELTELLRKQRELCAKRAVVNEDWYRGKFVGCILHRESIVNAPSPPLPSGAKKEDIQPVLRWVKASERLPIDDMDEDFPVHHIVRYKDDGSRGMFHAGSATYEQLRGIMKEWDYVEWLEEGEQPLTGEPVIDWETLEIDFITQWQKTKFNFRVHQGPNPYSIFGWFESNLSNYIKVK